VPGASPVRLALGGLGREGWEEGVGSELGFLYPTFEVASEDADSGKTIALGRSQSNDVVIENPSVSRLHALIHWDERERRWLITDAGSRNGMHVDGVYVPREEAAFLRDGAIIILGDVRLLFLLPLSLVAYIERRAQPPPVS
jgi:pSer/pThr/pTyr-binding forkhead associated (FHA) protein